MGSLGRGTEEKVEKHRAEVSGMVMERGESENELNLDEREERKMERKKEGK